MIKVDLGGSGEPNDRENHFIGTLRVRSAAILSERWLKPDSPELVGLAQRLGSLSDEEIDRGCRDEARVRYSRGEDS
jgi:hypothetical protein